MRIVPLLALLCLSLRAAVPTPQEHLGFAPGTDYKLADFGQISGYFQKLAQSTDRLKLVEFGRTSENRPLYLAIISDPANLQKLEHYRDINRRLALGLVPPAEAPALAAEAKAIVWIDSGLHATEVAPAQQAPELAYKMITDESPEMKKIRQNVILLQIPVINPDGLDAVAHWYQKNVGTPYEIAPLPFLYQKYSGHDNNRDWYMLNLPETRAVTKLLFQDWFPQIVYNQHQAPPFPARIFIPPYAEPLNPNIPSSVMEGINMIGAAMKDRFAREDKPGTLSYYGFDAWWNGGLRSVPAFHNMHGILTETAGYNYATPHTYDPKEFAESFPNGMPTKFPTVFYERPWMGGKWGVRDAIEYMLTADMAILELAASRSSQFAMKAYTLARQNMENRSVYAYVVPMDQPDPWSAVEMVRRLQWSGVQVQRAKAAFSANGKQYPAGSLVLLAGQPFRGYLVDLLEPQNYPELRTGTNGAVKRPYDIAGYTLSYQMGVQADRVVDRFSADLEPINEPLAPTVPTMDQRSNGSYLLVAEALANGRPVRIKKNGGFASAGDKDFGAAAFELQKPRVALYEPFTANMDAGWTEWVLDTFKVPFTVVHNADLQKGNLRQRFDSIIFASQATNSILHGVRNGERSGGARSERGASQQRPEYTGGIELSGLAQLEEFVRQGGTLVAFDAATEFPVQLFPLPVRTLLKASGDEAAAESGPAGGYYCPGSVLRVTVDTANPLAYGMPANAMVFSSGGQAFDITLLNEFNKGENEVHSVAKYASRDLLASGFLQGERVVAGRSILVEARHGQGRVILFGFRPQFRGQTFGTFKLLLNTLYLGSAKRL